MNCFFIVVLINFNYLFLDDFVKIKDIDSFFKANEKVINSSKNDVVREKYPSKVPNFNTKKIDINSLIQDPRFF